MGPGPDNLTLSSLHISTAPDLTTVTTYRVYFHTVILPRDDVVDEAYTGMALVSYL